MSIVVVVVFVDMFIVPSVIFNHVHKFNDIFAFFILLTGFERMFLIV
jgi:hypothetical protein